MKKQLLNTILSAAVLATLSVSAWAQTPSAAEVVALIETAQDNYEQSQQLGFAWRSARQAIETAQKALAAGQYEIAQQAAKTANNLAQASITQAQTEATAWRTRKPFAQSDPAN